MHRLKEVLLFLRKEGQYVSGDYISRRLSISRTAVWKYINQLERTGYSLDKLKGKGYKLLKAPEKPYPWEIERYLDTKFIGKKIIYKETVDSTNTLAFKLALEGNPEGTCVIAETQKGGKGRLNRAWFSPAGKNLYISIILRPAVHPTGIYSITFLSSLAVYDTIETLCGEKPTLKWPNDVLIQEKKVCGTLLELSTETDMVKFVVVGIGFNINMQEKDIQKGLKQRATSLNIVMKKNYERAFVCGILLNNLEKYYSIFKKEGAEAVCTIWEERAKLKGKHLQIDQMGESYKGFAEGIDRDGAILLNVDGKIKKIIAGDVNI